MKRKREREKVTELSSLPIRAFFLEKRERKQLGFTLDLDTRLSEILARFVEIYLGNGFSVVYFVHSVDFIQSLCYLISSIQPRNIPVIISMPLYKPRIVNLLCSVCKNKQSLPFCFEETNSYEHLTTLKELERDYYTTGLPALQRTKLVELLKKGFSLREFEFIVGNSYIFFLAAYSSPFHRPCNPLEFHEFDLLSSFLDSLGRTNQSILFIGRLIGWTLFNSITYRNLYSKRNIVFKLVKKHSELSDRFHFVLTDWEDSIKREKVSDVMYRLYVTGRGFEGFVVEDWISLIHDFLPEPCSYEDLSFLAKVIPNH